jgi:hypothetical protein
MPLGVTNAVRGISLSSRHVDVRPFSSIVKNISEEFPTSISPIAMLSNKVTLRKLLYNNQILFEENYLITQFTDAVSLFSHSFSARIIDYYAEKINLNKICVDFAKFCLDTNLNLSPEKTLESFSSHNWILDYTVKEMLQKLKPKESINLLGFGLADGQFEKEICDFIIQKNLAKSLRIYGYDPYGKKGDGIIYLNDVQNLPSALKFDLVVARWALHHVAPEHRWHNFVNCLNACTNDANILVVEHGILHNSSSNRERLTYRLLVSLYDTLANLGLRPGYFTDSAPNVGADFFVDYLESSDFEYFEKQSKRPLDIKLLNIGPYFPNQTICHMKFKEL